MKKREWWATGIFQCRDGTVYSFCVDIPLFMSGKQINDRLRRTNKYRDKLVLVFLNDHLSMDWEPSHPPTIGKGDVKNGRVLWGNGEGVYEKAFLNAKKRNQK